jgi:hypothetical protein
MKASELIAALQAHMVDHGDVNVTISTSATSKGAAEKAGMRGDEPQGYAIADASYVVAEQYEDHVEIMIRNWPY